MKLVEEFSFNTFHSIKI